MNIFFERTDSTHKILYGSLKIKYNLIEYWQKSLQNIV